MGFVGKDLPLQLRHAGFGGGELLGEALHRGGGLQGLDAQVLAHGVGLVIGAGEVAPGPLPAEDLHPHAGAELLAGEDLDDAHLARPEDMGAAAGAAVRLREGDDAHLPRQGLFAAVVQLLQLRRGGVGDLHRGVRPDDLVGLVLRRQGLLPGDVRVVVDGDGVGPQMEAHIVTVVVMAQNTGEDVLPGVLLHVVEAPGPVNAAGDVFANFHRFFDSVDYHPVLFMDIGDGNAAQGPVVGGLAASLGIEGGAVQGDKIPALARLAGEDFGGKGGEKGVGIVEFFRFHGEAFLSCQRIDAINCHTGSARKIPRAAEQRLARTP